MTAQDLQTLLTGLLAGIGRTTSVNVQAFDKPEKFKGEKVDAERFMSQCEAFWVTANIADDHRRVMTAIGRLTDKAAQWAVYITDHVAAHAGALPTEVDTWDKFKTVFRTYFGESTPEDKAIIDLDKLVEMDVKTRSARDVGTYVSEFQALTARIPGLSEKDKQIRFTRGLPNRIFSTLSSHETPPANYAAWVERSLKLYGAYERIRAKEAADKPAPSSTSSTTSKPTSSARPSAPAAPRPFVPRAPPANPNHVPMDVDASRVETRTCYNCGKPGHLSRYCPEPRRPRQPRIAASQIPFPDATGGVDLRANASTSSSSSTPSEMMQIMAMLTKFGDRVSAFEDRLAEMAAKKKEEDF